MYWMPCGKALTEDAPDCLLCGSPVKSTEATHPHPPDTLRESVRLLLRGESYERIEIS
jgi:hypothetical protein